MAYSSLLYQSEIQELGAPKLVHGPGAKADGVNIHKDYTWTLSKKSAREYIPKLLLTEYKLVLSSEVAGFLYTLRGEMDNLNVIVQQSAANFSNLGSAAVSTAGQAGQDIVNGFNKFLDKATIATDKEKKIGSSPTSAGKPLGNAMDEAQKNSLATNLIDGLDVYKGLYAIEPTDWTYVMPYLGNANMVSPGNTWGEGSQMKEAITDIASGVSQALGGLGKAAQTVGDAAKGSKGGNGGDIFSVLLGGAKAMGGARNALLGLGGGLILKETPQSFTGTGSDSIECSFYLLNTAHVDDIRKNWEFCYLFTYQNLANRKGINLLDPPCLYRALIPGYKQLPICWVTNLTITNVGSTKMLDIKTGEPASSSSAPWNVKMIPEAYKISFTLESALKNARNIFQFAADPSGVVNVSFKDNVPTPKG